MYTLLDPEGHTISPYDWMDEGIIYILNESLLRFVFHFPTLIDRDGTNQKVFVVTAEHFEGNFAMLQKGTNCQNDLHHIHSVLGNKTKRVPDFVVVGECDISLLGVVN